MACRNNIVTFVDFTIVCCVSFYLQLARDHNWSVLGTCCPNSIDDVYLGAPVLRCDEYKMTSPTIVILGEWTIIW